MPRPLLVVVSGPPGAGKTVLAQRLAEDLGLPLLNKDGFKETLYEALGWSDPDWSRRLGHASMELLFHAAGRLLAAGVSVIVEANFSADLSCRALEDLQTRYQADACQVLCFGNPDVIARRFLARIESGERHPGHGDQWTLDDLLPLIGTGRTEPLCLKGLVIELDTTDFSALNLQALCRTVTDLLPSPVAR